MGDLLLKIGSMLEDAEHKQRTKDSVKIWLNELRDLAYDREDTLDEFAAEALRRRLLVKHEHQPSSCKVWKFVHACLNSLMMSLQSVRIKEMDVRLQDIGIEKNYLDLIPITVLVNEDGIHGMGNNNEGIVYLFLQHDLRVGGRVYPVYRFGRCRQNNS